MKDSPEKSLVESLEQSVSSGAQGLKVWKDLGLRVRDKYGMQVLPDDSRLHDLWESAAVLQIPVAIHTADPVAFFDPIDNENERLEELLAHPEWSYCAPGYPAFNQLIASLESVVAAHPRTTFIGLHVGCYAEDLAWVDGMLRRYSNFYIDIASRIAELGRQPRAARQLIMNHSEKVLFGTDEIPPNRDMYQIYFRFAETADEYFEYSPYEYPPTGRWAISALDLPMHILKRIYFDNARGLVP